MRNGTATGKTPGVRPIIDLPRPGSTEARENETIAKIIGSVLARPKEHGTRLPTLTETVTRWRKELADPRRRGLVFRSAEAEAKRIAERRSSGSSQPSPGNPPSKALKLDRESQPGIHRSLDEAHLQHRRWSRPEPPRHPRGKDTAVPTFPARGASLRAGGIASARASPPRGANTPGQTR